MKLLISVCTYQNGTFDVILIDKDTREEVTLSGEQRLDDEQFGFVNRIAPACIWTEYERVTPEYPGEADYSRSRRMPRDPVVNEKDLGKKGRAGPKRRLDQGRKPGTGHHDKGTMTVAQYRRVKEELAKPFPMRQHLIAKLVGVSQPSVSRVADGKLAIIDGEVRRTDL